jgi:phospholipid/cholesterol/gamma-HCH transport system substrate-binding protein
MEKDARYFTVGVFVSIAILALVGFSIWLAGVHDFARHERYTIYFTDPVSGLDQEATVKYKGVEVGKILRLRLSPERNDLVKVDVEVREETPVRDKTLATVEVQGVTGASYIELATPNGDETPPPTMAGEKYPVLKGQGSQFNKFLDSVPQLSSQFQTTLSAIGDLTKEGSKTAESVRGLANKLKDNPSQIITPPSNKGVEVPK